MDDEGPGEALFVLLNAAFVAMLFVTTWLALRYEIAPSIVACDVGSCALGWHWEHGSQRSDLGDRTYGRTAA